MRQIITFLVAFLVAALAHADMFENGELTVGREAKPLTEAGCEVGISPFSQSLPYVFPEGGENYSGVIFTIFPKFRYDFDYGSVGVALPFVLYRLKPGSIIPAGTPSNLPRHDGASLGNATLRLQFQKVFGEDVGGAIGGGLELAAPTSGEKALMGSSGNLVKLAQFSPDTFTATPYLTTGFDFEFLLFQGYTGLLVMVPTKDSTFLSASGSRSTELRLELGASAILSLVDFFNVLLEISGQKGLSGEDTGTMLYLNPGVRLQIFYLKPGVSFQLPLMKPGSREAYLSDYGVYIDLTLGDY